MPTIPSGISGQIGIVDEASYGAGGTPNRFFPFRRETLTPNIQTLYDHGIGTGRFQPEELIRHHMIGGGGEVEISWLTKGMALLMLQMLGQNTIEQVGITTEYTHTAIPDPLALQGQSLGVQVGKPAGDGDVEPFMFRGSKITGFQLVANRNEWLRAILRFDVKDVVLTEPLAALTLPAGFKPFSWADVVVTVGGVTKFCNSASIDVNNQFNTDRWGLGLVKKEPIANGEMTATGELDCEFENPDEYNNFINGTLRDLIMTVTSPTEIEPTKPFKLIATLPKIEITGSAPVVEGMDIIRQRLSFKALKTAASPLITLTAHTTDTAL